MKNSKQDKKTNNKLLIVTNILLLVVIFVLIFYMVIGHSKAKQKDKKIIRDSNEEYQFTNPILDCENVLPDEGVFGTTSDYRNKIEEVKKEYNIKDISFYVRDLNNGPWIGINEKETFSPASLLKTPIVMALFKYAESNPDILNKEIVIQESDIIQSFNQNITFSGVLETNKKYTLLEIAEIVITKSDNTGVGIILRNIPASYLADVFNDSGVPYKDEKTEVDVNVKDYAGFFRILFNSSYLNREMSEKILGILSNSDYKNGLVAGVPENIKVAHKFGERNRGDFRQLHDCGVVYHTKTPYLICIMTRGNDYKSEESAIKELSSFTYQKVLKNSGN